MPGVELRASRQMLLGDWYSCDCRFVRLFPLFNGQVSKVSAIKVVAELSVSSDLQQARQRVRPCSGEFPGEQMCDVLFHFHRGQIDAQNLILRPKVHHSTGRRRQSITPGVQE